MSAPQGKRAHAWVQPIVVAKEGTHADTILCGATASVALYLGDQDWPSSPIPMTCFDDWLAGPFTKTVRRGSYKDITRVIDWCIENKVPYEGVEAGDSAAFALPPMRYADLPGCVSRLQVTGTDLPRTPRTSPDVDRPAPWVTLHVDETLSTGKATTQVAHAIWAWTLDWTRPVIEAGQLETFRDLGWPTDLHLTTAASLAHLSGPGTFPIRDNGLTEVVPNTLTAVAEARSPQDHQ